MKLHSLLKKVSLIYLKGKGTESGIQENLPSTDSLLKQQQWLWLGQAKPAAQNSMHVLHHGKHAPKDLGHILLLSQGHKQGVDLELKQPELRVMFTWESGLTHCTTTLAQNFFFSKKETPGRRDEPSARTRGLVTTNMPPQLNQKHHSFNYLKDLCRKFYEMYKLIMELIWKMQSFKRRKTSVQVCLKGHTIISQAIVIKTA